MKKSKRLLYQGGALAAVFAFAAVPLAASAQQTSNTTINATVGSTISMSTQSTVAISLAPGGNSVVSSSSDVVTVSTNNTSGYRLQLANNDANTSLVSDGNNIQAHAGTHAAPTALADNRWGYAIAGAPFSTSYSAETNNISSTSLWAGVPASGSPVTLKNRPGTAASDTTTVWYGVRVNAAQPTGTYTDTVTYTATVN